jgi:hypothetical protein
MNMEHLEQRFSKTAEGLSMKWVLTEDEPCSEEQAAEAQEYAQEECEPLPICA